MADQQTEVTEDGRVHTESPAEGAQSPGTPQDERAHAQEPAEGDEASAQA